MPTKAYYDYPNCRWGCAAGGSRRGSHGVGCRADILTAFLHLDFALICGRKLQSL